MTVRRCRMSHQRSRVPAHGCSGVSVSINVPRVVIEPEHSFLNLSRIQSCSFSFSLGIVHETLNVIDLVICETTLDEHVIRTPVWVNSNTSFHSICVCHVLCCKEVLQGPSSTFALFDVNQTATCSATSVARSVQLGSIQTLQSSDDTLR